MKTRSIEEMKKDISDCLNRTDRRIQNVLKICKEMKPPRPQEDVFDKSREFCLNKMKEIGIAEGKHIRSEEVRKIIDELPILEKRIDKTNYKLIDKNLLKAELSKLDGGKVGTK